MDRIESQRRHAMPRRSGAPLRVAAAAVGALALAAPALAAEAPSVRPASAARAAPPLASHTSV